MAMVSGDRGRFCQYCGFDPNDPFVAAAGSATPTEDDVMRCPDCGSENIEKDDPRPGEHTCRDCGGWIDEDEP
jgi:hypothetical protein